MLGEALASAVEFGHGFPAGFSIGAMVTVKPSQLDAEVDVQITVRGAPVWTSVVHSRASSAWTLLVEGSSGSTFHKRSEKGDW